MSTVILKNLYRGGNKVKQMFRDGEKIYQMLERFIFEVDADSLTFDYEGNTLTLTITASDPWTMTKPEWITASSVSGIGNTTVTLTVPQNPTEDSRDGNIVLTCEGRTITIPVEQKGDIGLDTPLTFEITSDGYVNWQSSASNIIKTIQYKLNNGSWTSVTSTTSGVHIPVVTGDKIQFKGSNNQYSSSDSNYTSFYNSTCGFIAYGNTMSLLYGDDFSGKTTLPSTFVLTRLFQSCTGLTDASNLFLPALTVTSHSYQLMFLNCSGLTQAPELLFTGFTGEYNCQNMFGNCTSLTTGPELKPLTLETGCYANFFYGCTNLSYIKCLATNRSAINSTNNWVKGVAATGTFVKNPNMNSWPTGVAGIPSGWTVQEADE